MNPLTQMTQAMKAGTSNKSHLAEQEKRADHGPSREELNQFLENIAVCKTLAVNGGINEMEAPRKVVEFYNRNNIKGFDDVGYFIFEGIKVYENGKVDDAKLRDSLTMEEKNHQGKK